MSREDRRVARQLREVAGRAVRRLGLLEYVILAAAAVLALLAGAITALLLNAALGVPFRPAWAAAALLLFSVPALLAYRKELRERRGRADGPPGPGSGGGGQQPR